MLTELEQQRLLSNIPSSFEVVWQEERYTYDHEIWWANEDDDQMGYPRLVLDWDVRAETKPAWQPMNQKTEINATDTEIEQVRGERVFDELVCRCITSGRTDEHDDLPESDPPIPSKVRANALANEIFSYFHFTFDQNRVGENGERPVLARVVQPPIPSSDYVADDPSDGYQFAVRLHYTMVHEEMLPAVEGVEGSATLADDDTTLDWS